jgi:acyl carrier protein
MDTLTDDVDLAMDRRIRDVLREYGRLNKNVDELGTDTDLYQSGMTSHASVNVMLALESNFDVEFPDHMLKRSVFASIGAIRQALAQLGAS